MGGQRRAPRLMLVTDGRRARLPLPELVAAAVAGGVDAGQLREPDLGAAELADLAERLRGVIAGRAALLVSGAANLAAAQGLGLHLSERGLGSAQARRRIGPAPLLGRSVHPVQSATGSPEADYLTICWWGMSSPRRTSRGERRSG